jgi:hypothetical protein
VIPGFRTFTITALALMPVLVSGEEGGSGHYFPGSMASFMDGVAAKETLLVRYNLLNYEGAAGVDRPIPIGGRTVVNADVSTWGNGFTVFWRPAIDLGEQWSYGMSATVSIISLDIAADGELQAGQVRVNRALSDSITGVGDIVLIPVMLNQVISRDFNINYRLAFYAPTGSYEVGRLANTGKNFWTIEPTVGFMYFGQQNGRELSVFLGADFNQENADTDYRSGTQAHIETTAAQHFPLWGGLAGAGVTGYWYEQVTGDSGSGAKLGEFKAKAIGAGPVASFAAKVGGHDLISELKWLHEFDTQNRFAGDTVFLKVIYKFY